MVLVSLFALPKGYRYLPTGEPIKRGDIRLKVEQTGSNRQWMLLVNPIPNRRVLPGEIVARYEVFPVSEDEVGGS